MIRADSPGLADEEVLRRGASEERIIITFDKNFGELVFGGRLPTPSGVILLCVRAPDPARVTQLAVAALASRDDWAGHFSVVENDRIRMTPLP